MPKGPIEWIAQAVGLFAIVVFLLSYQQKERKKKERYGFLQWFHRWLLSRFSAYYHTVILFSGFSMFVYNLF